MTDSARNPDGDPADVSDRGTLDEAPPGSYEDWVSRGTFSAPAVIERRPFDLIHGSDCIDELSVVDEDSLAIARPSDLARLIPTADGQGQPKTGADDLTRDSEFDTLLDPSDLVTFYDGSFDRISRKIAVLFHGDIGHAEDITQQAFIEVFKRWPRIASMKNPYGYTAKIAWNLAMRWFRARNREVEAAGLLASRAGGMSDLEGADLRLDLARVMSELPEHERTVAGLSVMDYTPKEIAEILEVPPATARSRLKRARARLKAALKDSQGGSKA